jgi:hypothetical protein
MSAQTGRQKGPMQTYYTIYVQCTKSIEYCPGTTLSCTPFLDIGSATQHPRTRDDSLCWGNCGGVRRRTTLFLSGPCLRVRHNQSASKRAQHARPPSRRGRRASSRIHIYIQPPWQPTHTTLSAHLPPCPSLTLFPSFN